jgi:hypothetical protein
MPVTSDGARPLPTLSRGQIDAALAIRSQARDAMASVRAAAQARRRFPGFGEAAVRTKLTVLRTWFYAIPPWPRRLRTNAYRDEVLVPHFIAVLSGPGAASTWQTVEKLSVTPQGPRLYSLAAKFAHHFLDSDGLAVYDNLAYNTVRYHLGRQRRPWPQQSPPCGWYRGWLDDLDDLRRQVGSSCTYADLDAYL